MTEVERGREERKWVEKSDRGEECQGREGVS